MAGIGERTVGYIVNEVTTAIVECLWEDTVKKHMPKSEEEFRSKILDMEEAWQFPCCWSAVDGCHIPIKCPPGGLESCKKYHNFKNFFSVVLMGMVDSKYRFVWASCGYPGKFTWLNHFSVHWFMESNQEPMNISPKLARKWVPFLYLPWYLAMQHFLCNRGWWSHARTLTLRYNKDITTTGWAEPEWWRRVLLGNLREGGGFCLGDVSAARRIRRRQPLLVSFNIIFALKRGIR